MNIMQPLDNKFLYSIDNLRLSHNSRQTYKCARKLEQTKFFLHSEDVERNLPGDVGNALHRGYQDYLINRDREKAIFAMMLAYPIDLNSNPYDFRSIEACYATLNAMIDSQAFLEYEIAKVQCLDGEIRPAIEVPFEISIKNFSISSYRYIPVTYVGLIDAILFDKMTGEYIVVDIKTTRFYLNDMTPVYFFDDQCIPYAIVLERVLGHEIETLNIKYLSVYVDIKDPKVRVYPFDKSKADIADWARGFYIDLQDIKRYTDLHWFPRNHNLCVNFKQVCKFFDTCQKRDVVGLQKLFLMHNEPLKVKPFEPWIKMELELAA